MDQNDIRLEQRLVKDITGRFIVPDYQRGYRWGAEEVRRLLEDINSSEGKKYCLQPVVVKRRGQDYELIDGQQRLTTIYLIYTYMREKGGNLMPAPAFSLVYETREKSEEFLKSIDISRKDENIDFWFMAQAYQEIDKWFTENFSVSVFLSISSYFEKSVYVIWYEVGESEDVIALFTRLNIGKIPLTSAELVKAMFLSRDNNDITDEKQKEIALQWDNIERELHSDSLWYFLSNQAGQEYQTRIDLVLNLMAENDGNQREKYATFFYFDNLRKENKNLNEIWRSIQHTFLMLKDWYENHELYHKIGYLIASKDKSVQQIYAISANKKKAEFIQELDSMIRDSIQIKGNYADLSYEKPKDYQDISRLLLLFNVESVRQIDEQTQWFPFDKFKYGKKGKENWTLEHIHAQQSQGLQGQDVWKQWLLLHIPSVRAIGGKDDLVERMEKAAEAQPLTRQDFETLQEETVACLSVQGNTEYLHCISNLAMLNSGDNAALNNSTFDVKRNEIIRMDKSGQYIPFCTKMVFLKYYTGSEENQLHFWGQADRIAYIKAINHVLQDYLEEEIHTLEEA